MKKYLSNLIGWRTNRKIVVIESDDWGSFRFKDAKTRDKFLTSEEKDKCWMSYNDCFESAKDLEELYNVLNLVKDKNDKAAKFTFLMNPSNPNFKKIKDSNFQEFYNETFLETLSKRVDGKEILSLYNKGIKDGIIEIAFHGREHLNVKRWMRDLKNKDQIAHLGFKNNMWGFSKNYIPKLKYGYRSTYDMDNEQELIEHEKNIREGINFINKTFSQDTTYFLPPDGPYHLKLNKELVRNGIKYIGLPKIHLNPTNKGFLNKKLFWLGKKTNTGLTVITRNVIFEPGSPRYTDWVSHALSDIENAFSAKKPAVISSHRANYVGGLNIENRTSNLAQIRILLNQILIKWPEVEFMTSSQLGNLISRKND